MLAFNIDFPELYTREGLLKLDAAFLTELKRADLEIHDKLLESRTSLEESSDFLMSLAPYVEDFIGELFGVTPFIRVLAAQHNELAPLYACKRLFVQRRAIKAYNAEQTKEFDGKALKRRLEELCGVSLVETIFAKVVLIWQENEEENKEALEIAKQYAAWASHHHIYPDSILFNHPKKLEPEHLVHKPHHLRHREGFALTDEGAYLDKVLDNAHYCIYCHHQERDSCSKGIKEKNGSFKQNSFGITLAGCPLEEKISEMNELKANGVPIGALAMAIIDNPMLAGTGHRICNDCMKACIYQKQDPVDIPQIETRTLKDVLDLPYGYEIYSLLTRWNPLNIERPYPKEQTGKKVLVVGLGPAGYTLAHHLLNDGHTVVAVDGLKIEPLPIYLSGVNEWGERSDCSIIKDVNSLYEDLDKRAASGFGGVAEYGITVRWNKNYLKLIRLLLERRTEFTMIGGVRFGGTLTKEQAWQLGFDHIALCMGAGKPTILNIPNGMARGVRTASDFLMALQLTGSARKDSIANLQLRLPVLVIGGGLTAIDAATESLAYYPVQVEKFLARYEALGEPADLWKSEEEKEVAAEFIAHAKALREERERAAHENREPAFIPLLNQWGGVKMVYRKRLMDAPSYRLNHEEVQKALEEGIEIVENLSPASIQLDKYAHTESVTFQNDVTFPARTVLVAAGTSPNTILALEDAEHFSLDGRYFQAVDGAGNPVSPERVAKPGIAQVLLSKEKDGKGISFFGDLHPSFAGNVVKAMGSAKQGYPVISRLLAEKQRNDSPDFIQNINRLLRPCVQEVKRLTPNIVEVILNAPMQAKNFQPGQFYRLQNFEKYAKRSAPDQYPTTLSMEGIALTGAWVNKELGLISLIVLEMGGSSDLCAYLEEGEPVILMGPTGAPTEIFAKSTVMLVGGGLGNAVLFSIGKAMKAAGTRVLYFAGYKQSRDRYKIEEIEAASDVVVWCCDEEDDFTPNRENDFAFKGNIIQAIQFYAENPSSIKLNEVKHIIAIGSDKMMAAVATARHSILKPYLAPDVKAIASINSPMQCMMKEICAQCLQQHTDPETGEITYVYSCFNQDQDLDRVSFSHLNERLKQNNVQEKLTNAWIKAAMTDVA